MRNDSEERHGDENTVCESTVDASHRFDEKDSQNPMNLYMRCMQVCHNTSTVYGMNLL